MTSPTSQAGPADHLEAGLESLAQIASPMLAPLFRRPRRTGQPSGWWGHVPFAFWITALCEPRILVELGTHHGVSYAAFCEAVLCAGLPTRCYAIDHWKGDAHAGRFGDEVYEELSAFNTAAYGTFSVLIRADFDDALCHFEDGSIDLLHIDGLHTYEAVRHDYEAWRPKLSSRAVLLFHDTNVRRDDFGVHRLFAELAAEFPHFEFLHGHGLGLIAHGAQVPAAVARLCGAGVSDLGLRLRERFATLGEVWEGQAREQESARSFKQQLATLHGHLEQAASERDAAGQRLDEAQRLLARMADERDLAAENCAALESRLEAALAAAHPAGPDDGSDARMILESLLRRHGQAQTAVPWAQRWRRVVRRIRRALGDPTARLDPLVDVVRHSLLFDPDWYLATYPDVAAAGADPARHYAGFGALEGRDPGPWFSTAQYLRCNADVAAAGVNPLVHYEVHGRLEGRALPSATAPTGAA